MHETVNNFLLAESKFMLERHLRQPAAANISGFTYSTRRSFTKNKKRIQKFTETGDSTYIYQNELDKACFQHDMSYSDFKDLYRRAASNKVLREKAFNIAKNPKFDGNQHKIASMVYKVIEKKSKGVAVRCTAKSAIKCKTDTRAR